jgi:hypothetical protein
MGRNPATGEAIKDQGKQESRIPGGQGFEDGGLTAGRNALNICPVNVNGNGRGPYF